MTDVVSQAGETIEKIGKNDRTLFAGVMFGILIIIAYLVWSYTNNQTSITDSFLGAMEKRDDKWIQVLQANTEALNKNTEVMVEIKAKIR